MYERLLDKSMEPDEKQIERHLGHEAMERLGRFSTLLREKYRLVRELRFPFGGSYGWGYKYSHGTKHLFYLFFEQGAFTVTLQLGDREAPEVETRLPELLVKTRELWAGRYPCGAQGGWVHYRVLFDGELNDVLELVRIKKKPALVIR